MIEYPGTRITAPHAGVSKSSARRKTGGGLTQRREDRSESPRELARREEVGVAGRKVERERHAKPEEPKRKGDAKHEFGAAAVFELDLAVEGARNVVHL